jgi:hypothetical protein
MNREELNIVSRNGVEYQFNTKGVIEFDPIDVTKKHIKQSEWKKTVIAKIDVDLSEYYYWFIKKRYNINLATPLRDTHLTLINDRLEGNGDAYKTAKRLYSGKVIDIQYNIDVRSEGTQWWLRAKSSDAIYIRKEAGFTPEPFFNFHITIGRLSGRDWEIEDGKRVYHLIKKYGGSYL